tara:strand:+ start:50 stop:739 length:690 start_codon:yes stop_codon:yes gene_type:complete
MAGKNKMNITKINHEIELEFATNNPCYYFISTGQSENSNKIFYTLRKTFINTSRYFDGMSQPFVDSKHIQNLSTVYENAVSKAKNIVDNQPLKITSEQDMNSWGDGSYDHQEQLRFAKFRSEKKSLEIAENFMTQYAELEYKQVVPLTEDRMQFEGKIINTKFQENQFGGTLKMLFEDIRGFRLWGSVPSKLLDEELNNLNIKFLASVQVSNTDTSFGFFKRPTKVEVS